MRSDDDALKDGAASRPFWMLLVFQLPAKPPYLRVKIWRRLQALGAISVKNSVYALPAGDQAVEDFQWLLREIEQGGGDGLICEANLVDGLSDQEVRALFDAARDADYEEIAAELRRLDISSEPAEERLDIKSRLLRLRRRYAEVSAIDFFNATGRMTVEGLLTGIDTRLARKDAGQMTENQATSAIKENLTGKIWVTRQGVHIDRIACVWLIRRFIDPGAAFKFVQSKEYAAVSGELRFDMFKGEFTHEGDQCSFEVLFARTGIDDPALRAIAEIIHDIDLKDGKFGREETIGIAHVIAGVCASQNDDLIRIARGSAILDDTYAYFRRNRAR